MIDKSKAVIAALLLGSVCPALILAPLQHRSSASHSENEGETTQTVCAPVTECTEPVKTENLQIPLLQTDGTVCSVDMQTYVIGVVLSEMPAQFEPEALKAQAVVARTYTLRRMLSGGKHENAWVCTDPACCQAFCSVEEYITKGGTKESVDKVISAVQDTGDLIVTYDSKPIEATYFSCSGGSTEDAKAVWGTEIPYLTATDSPGEEQASHYSDTVTFTVEGFFSLLGRRKTEISGSWPEKVTYTAGGGVDQIQICGISYSGTQMRQKLGLRSTAFSLSVSGNCVTVTTRGYGHRVGMSQYGADAMAVQGKTFPEILSHYYRGTTLESMSPYIDKAELLE